MLNNLRLVDLSTIPAKTSEIKPSIKYSNKKSNDMFMKKISFSLKIQMNILRVYHE